MIQWEDNRIKREEREQQEPKAGKYDRWMNRSGSVRGRGGVLLSYDNYSMLQYVLVSM